MVRRILLLLLVAGMAKAYGQLGGNATYQFLTVQPNARIAAMGGTAISLDDNDLNLAVQNPSMLKPSMANQITYNHVFLFDGISSGYAGYAFNADSVGTFGIGMQYINYGDFKRTTANGDVIGSFSAGEYCMNIGFGKRLNDSWSVGGQFKTI